MVGQVRRAFERAQEERTAGPGPLRPLPSCVADGQAGADRDRYQQGHHLVRLRRSHRRPRRRPGGIARRPSGGGRRRRHGSRCLPCPVGHRTGRRTAARRRREPLGRPGRRTSCVRPRPGPSTCERRRSTTWRGELAEADVVLTAVAAESHVLSVTDFAGVIGPTARDRPRGAAQRGARAWPHSKASRCSTWTR